MIEQLIEKYGEQYRDLIVSAIEFLDQKELSMGLSTPIDREKFIKGLVDAAKV